MKDGNFVRGGVEYGGFSVEKASEGGWSQRDLKYALREAGIKFTMKDENGKKAYTPYVGQWSIYIEAEFADEVSSWLWSGKKLVGRGKNESA